jgi:hypothetical protein
LYNFKEFEVISNKIPSFALFQIAEKAKKSPAIYEKSPFWSNSLKNMA